LDELQTDTLRGLTAPIVYTDALTNTGTDRRTDRQTDGHTPDRRFTAFRHGHVHR